MKRNYYHFYPTCPHCHEPHNENYPLKRINDAKFECKGCKAIFKKNLSYTWQDGEAGDFDYNLPLMWRIILNPVERSYVDWIENRKKGNYIITWPWDRVKFLPVLLNEVLMNRENEKITVIGKTEKSGEDNYFNEPSLADLSEKIVFSEDGQKPSKPLKKKIYDFVNYNKIFEKKDVIYARIYIRGEKGFKKLRFTDTSNFGKAKNRVVDIIEKEYGKNSVGQITKEDRGEDRDPMEYRGFDNEDAKIEKIRLIRKNEYTQNSLNYSKKWMAEILENKDQIRSVKLTGKNIEFISQRERNLKKKLKNSDPDLLIVQNLDYFLRYLVINPRRAGEFVSALKENESDLVLMFTSEKDKRHLLQSGPFEELYENWTVHSWDTKNRLEYLKKEKNWDYKIYSNESKYKNPCSSKKDELPEEEKNPKIKYREVSVLSELQNELEEYLDELNIDRNVYNDIEKFFNIILWTPLFLKGDYSKSEVFSYQGQSLSQLTYDQVIREIYSHDEDIAMEIRNRMDEVYHDGDRNPLTQKIIQSVKGNIDGDSYVSVVVRKSEIRGVKRILKENIPDDIRERVEVCSWTGSNRSLKKREQEIDESTFHTVVSARYPQIDYNIYSSSAQKFIFAGCSKNLDFIREIIDKRIMEKKSRPAVTLEENESSPDLLEEIEENIIEDEKISNELKYEIEEENSLLNMDRISVPKTAAGGGNRSTSDGSENYDYLYSDDTALLITDSQDRGVFLPERGSLYEEKKNQHDIHEIKIPDSVRNLEGKKIYLNKRGILRSIKKVFTEAILRYSEGTSIESGTMEWNGFKELLKCSGRWIDDLWKAVDFLREEKNISEERASGLLARELSDMSLVARNPDHIRKWWEQREKAETIDYGNEILYIYDIEHPKGRDDLSKIYRKLDDLAPDLDFDRRDPYRIYNAARMVQEIRSAFLKKDKKGIIETSEGLGPLLSIYEDVKQELIDEIESNFERFSIQEAKKVKLNQRTKAFLPKEDFEYYIK